jgi:hypothetical protein
MWIDPHFDLSNYFFRVWHPQDPNAELTILGGGGGYPHQVWARCRSLLRHPHVQIDERVAEVVVLVEERCRRITPRVYR